MLRTVTYVRHAESRGNVDESTYTDTPDWKVPLVSAYLQTRLFDRHGTSRLGAYKQGWIIPCLTALAHSSLLVVPFAAAFYWVLIQSENGELQAKAAGQTIRDLLTVKA